MEPPRAGRFPARGLHLRGGAGAGLGAVPLGPVPGSGQPGAALGRGADEVLPRLRGHVPAGLPPAPGAWRG
ncbi:hypothetical protein HGM15179_021779, partial [Zosterops borbonicus]